MDPLDLTAYPPRSPYEKLEGLFMMPRTIDKLRAKLPGGKIGTYTIRGSSPLLPGLSLVLLDGIGVAEEGLFEVVRQVLVEDEIAAWLRKNADLSRIAALNEKLLGRRIQDVQTVVPPAVLAKVYPFMEKMAKTTPMFEVLLLDDRLMFPNHFGPSGHRPFAICDLLFAIRPEGPPLKPRPYPSESVFSFSGRFVFAANPTLVTKFVR